MRTVINTVYKPLGFTLNRLESWMKYQGKDFPSDTDWSNSIEATWYLTPKQHATELLFISTGAFVSTLYYLAKVLDPGSATWNMLITFRPATAPTGVEHLLALGVFSSFSLTLYHKIVRKNKMFMLQPCHMGAGLLLFTLCNPNKSSIAMNLLFNIYLHTQWGGIAALLFPDLRDHELFGETFNFFAEHILILVAPVYMIYSGRYLLLPPSLPMTLLSFSVFSFFHSPILQICSLTSGLNLNYMFSPPPSKS
ncbi:transmembrane protein [Sporodiniella umbellata]|nr:transmembrane protein [Sporodiniella umbellata]